MGKKLTTQEVIERFKNIHGSTYDYSLVNYQGDSKKVKIICRHHGVFEQQPASHGRQKQGCPKCSRERVNNIVKTRLIGNDKFIERIEKIFGKNKFDYSKLYYQGAHKDVTLICKDCGNVETKDPRSFYCGYGCLKCRPKKRNPKQVTKKQFIERAKKIHGEKYDYSKVSYVTLYNEVEIICPKHGSFYQKPTVHIHAKSNCPECNVSKGEEIIGIWLNSKEIKYEFQYKVRINNSNHYYDFYLPDYNIMIEFNGLQHYKPIKFFGGQEGFSYLQERDKIKERYCLENQIKLLILKYNDDIEDILNKTLNV
jgi:hypothetical protein